VNKTIKIAVGVALFAAWVYSCKAETIDSVTTVNGMTIRSHTVITTPWQAEVMDHTAAPRTESYDVARMDDNSFYMFFFNTNGHEVLHFDRDGKPDAHFDGFKSTADGFTLPNGRFIPRSLTGTMQAKQLRAALNVQCRGGSGDDPHTITLCQLRDAM
jgi:hypothetical protein